MSDRNDRTDRIDGPVTRGVDATAMVLAHEGFVREQAKRWTMKLPHLIMHEDDLIQEGRLGLLWAARHFDAGRGVKFLSLAGKAVFNLQRNFVERCSHQVRFGRGASIEWVYLDAPYSEDRDEQIEGIMERLMPEPMIYDDEETRALLHGAMQCLTARERRVLRGLFVEEMTYTALAEELGFTRSRIPQIKAEALVKLRRVLLPRLTMGE